MRTADLLRAAIGWMALASTAGAADVVFVLGTDAPGRQPFYAVAAEYHRRNAPDATLVTSLRSLAEVREYLVRHRGEEAWDNVTLVAHGAPWIGLHVPVFVDGPEASLGQVQRAASDGTFPALPVGVFDDGTRLRLESCGLGRRPDFNSALGKLYSDTAGRPVEVTSSLQFVTYWRSATTVMRDELPFAFDVVPGRGVQIDPNLHRRLHDELAALGMAPTQATELEVLPIRLDLQMGSTIPGRDVRLQRLLAADPVLAGRLRDHGLRLSQLDWRTVYSAGAIVRAEGRATLFLLRPRLDVDLAGAAP